MKKDKKYIDKLGKGYREIILENSNGFKSVTKTHKNKKKYTRKTKYKSNERRDD